MQKIGYQTGQRPFGVRQNIAMISQFLATEAQNAIDIGCSEGLISMALADSGLSVTGYEGSKEAYSSALKHQNPQKNINFINCKLSLADVEALPQVDVIVLLSVHHQMVKNLGLSDANHFLKVLAKKARLQLFFQPCCIHEKYGIEMPFSNNDYPAIENYFIDLVNSSESELRYHQVIGLSFNDIPKKEPFRPMILFSKAPIKQRQPSIVASNDILFKSRLIGN